MVDANQNSDKVSTATTEEEEAQRHGSKGKPPTLGQGVSLDSSKKAAEKPENAVVDIEQGGPGGVDAVHPVNCWRNMFEYAKLGSQQEPTKDGMEAVAVLQNKEDEKQKMMQPPVPPSIPPRVHPISKSPVVTGGTTDTDNSNPSQENAESSCKSKTAEWALLVTSVVLEATSAIFEQLGYPLPGMVMAFVALLLSILDLILEARGREITCDGRGLLPCFYRHDVRNNKPFASLVQYFGLAGALWQCCVTTVGYHYTHHKLVNPIKLCLLPFIFVLCVLISKVLKSSQLEPVVELKSR